MTDVLIFWWPQIYCSSELASRGWVSSLYFEELFPNEVWVVWTLANIFDELRAQDEVDKNVNGITAHRQIAKRGIGEIAKGKSDKKLTRNGRVKDTNVERKRDRVFDLRLSDTSRSWSQFSNCSQRSFSLNATNVAALKLGRKTITTTQNRYYWSKWFFNLILYCFKKVHLKVKQKKITWMV